MASNAEIHRLQSAKGDGVPNYTFVPGADQHDDIVQFTSLAAASANTAPLAKADQATASYNTALTLTASTLLANDSDPDGDVLSITAVGSALHGSVSLNGDQVTFTPFYGYVGFARFSYTVSDGHGGTATANVGVTVGGPFGGPGSLGPTYIYVGGATSGQTIDISGDGQSHSVIGSAFNDIFYGGTQKDTLNGNAGNDTINGGAGADLLTGGSGNDVLYGGTGSDSFIWTAADVTGSPPGTQDVIYDFEGAGDGRVSGDTLNFLGFSAGSTLTLKAQSTVSSHLYYYTLTDAASGAHEVIAINSLNGAALTQGDFLFH